MDGHEDSSLTRSGTKLIGEKRNNSDLVEKRQVVRKRTKMRDFESVLKSQESNSCEETSRNTNAQVTLDTDALQAKRNKRNSASIDLNSEGCVDSASNGYMRRAKKKKLDDAKECVASGGFGLVDLNSDDATSYVATNDNLKSRHESECASTTGPKEKKDPLKVWKEMKQNGFLSSSQGGILIQSGLGSSSHGGIPMPNQRGRKRNDDIIKKQLELAKRKEVDQFARIAAPSGLLNGLNPGIINHVRNRRQVHSIIEALVRSETVEHSNESREINLSKSLSNGSEEDGELNTIEWISDRNCVQDSASVGEDLLALKLSSSKAHAESSHSLEESANAASGVSLSISAAGVASQWLELLHQDIKGRLMALKRSRARVKAVITTELPFLIDKEFLSKDNESNCVAKKYHQARWTALFDQMEKGLSEEEIQLECWLNQVREMRVHCENGLQNFFQRAPVFGPQIPGVLQNYARAARADVSEKELAVRAAAASIYSTCNFLMSKENVSCF